MRLDRRDLFNSPADRLGADYLLIDIQFTNVTGGPVHKPRFTLTDAARRTHAQSNDGMLADDAYAKVDNLISPFAYQRCVLVFRVSDGPYWLHLSGEGSIYVDTSDAK
jgi:hypothetical protein